MCLLRSVRFVVLLVLLVVPYLSDAVSFEYPVDHSVAASTLLEADLDDDKAPVTLSCSDGTGVESASFQHAVSSRLGHHVLSSRKSQAILVACGCRPPPYLL